MIGPKSAATAVRKADGEIVIEKGIASKGVFSKIPVIRGITGL